MIMLLLALTALQDTTIVIHPDSSSVSLQARALPRLVSEEVIRFYNAPGTTRLVGRTRLPRGNEWRGGVAVPHGPLGVARGGAGAAGGLKRGFPFGPRAVGGGGGGGGRGRAG